MLQTAQQGIKLAQRFFVFHGEFKQHGSIGDLRFKVLLSMDFLFEAASLLHQFLGLFLVVPEVRTGGLAFNSFQFFPAGRDIKETSRAAQRACSDLHKKSSILELIKDLSSFLPNMP